MAGLFDHDPDVRTTSEVDSCDDVGFARGVDGIERLVAEGASAWLLSYGGIDWGTRDVGRVAQADRVRGLEGSATPVVVDILALVCILLRTRIA